MAVGREEIIIGQSPADLLPGGIYRERARERIPTMAGILKRQLATRFAMRNDWRVDF